MNKLLFTEMRNHLCALLIQEERLITVRILSDSPSNIGAIYIGKVKNVVKNINACFVEIADGELCFLPLKETTGAFLLNRKPDGRILEGDELPVQITREAQKTKQASLTAHISISNDIFAISLGKPGIGYSAKLSKTDKARINEFLKQNDVINKLTISELPYELSIGMVVRTQARDCSEEELHTSLQSLLTEWVKLLKTGFHRVCFTCLKEAPTDLEVVLRQVVYPYEYEEILTDKEDLYHQLNAYVSQNLPDKSVRLYQDTNFPLYKLYSLESKLKTALEPRIWLKSGGYLVIEPTEALTVIDVNSGKYEAGKNNQDAIYKINYEAAEEIALQLRLRNLSGIIVVDFINMDSTENKEKILKLLQELVRKDKQRTVVVDITPLGLVEITRKKEYMPLHEQFAK